MTRDELQDALERHPDPPPGLPGRVVDRNHVGWMLTRAGDGADVYTINHVTGYMTPDALAEEYGPLRPVERITDADEAELRRLLELAGRRAVYSLAVAVQRAYFRMIADAGGDFHKNTPDQWRAALDTAKQQLRAGRPGSWEADLLYQVALWADNEKPRRIHEEACAGMADVIYRWCTDPDRFTETADTLAAVVSSYADEQDRGWAAVADQWLQPGALDDEGVRLTYGLFFSQSEHFDYSALG